MTTIDVKSVQTYFETSDIKEPPSKKLKKPEKPRCFNCTKKIKLVEVISNKCKCDNSFCSKCKYPNEHNCTYKYSKIELNKNMGGGEFSKIDKL